MSSLFNYYARVLDRTDASPVIVHAPHGGRAIPAEHRGAFTIGDAELSAELDAMTDHFTDELAASVDGVSHVINRLSRFVVDVERFPDESEEMNAVGMGVLYTHGSRRQRIRSVSTAERDTLLDFFGAYSAAVTDLTDRALERHGRVVIIDVHSFPQHPLPYELHADERRPELCLGFDAAHAPAETIAAVRDAFDGWDVGANEPFHGAYVPLKHYQRDARVQAVMLEIRRDRYMDEGSGRRGRAAFDGLRRSIQALVNEVTGSAAEPGRTSNRITTDASITRDSSVGTWDSALLGVDVIGKGVDLQLGGEPSAVGAVVKCAGLL
ncbi:N-formylglutamate amidohydrolase [Rathayibacter sp. YIM 133350]|uniref:N-formylglutamate amidohydrolase n=1 Tax=Rathayibacter sp. YIM 133350 TaxID=3131992 RepID=UPI00307D0A20